MHNELRQARKGTDHDHAFDVAKLRHELNQAHQAIRTETEEVRCLNHACETTARHSEHANVKGAEIDKTRTDTIQEYSTKLHEAKEELKRSNQRRDQYQAELHDYRQEKYEMQKCLQNTEQYMHERLQGPVSYTHLTLPTKRIV